MDEKTQKNTENFLSQIKSWWVIVLFIGSLIVTWTNFDNAINTHEVRLKELENQNKQWVITLQQIQVDVAIIRTKLDK